MWDRTIVISGLYLLVSPQGCCEDEVGGNGPMGVSDPHTKVVGWPCAVIGSAYAVMLVDIWKKRVPVPLIIMQTYWSNFPSYIKTDFQQVHLAMHARPVGIPSSTKPLKAQGTLFYFHIDILCMAGVKTKRGMYGFCSDSLHIVINCIEVDYLISMVFYCWLKWHKHS